MITLHLNDREVRALKYTMDLFWTQEMLSEQNLLTKKEITELHRKTDEAEKELSPRKLFRYVYEKMGYVWDNTWKDHDIVEDVKAFMFNLGEEADEIENTIIHRE